MRTIFEGKVNGKTFDNVEAYNEEVARVLRAGEQLNASSRSRVVEDNDKECCKSEGRPNGQFRGVINGKEYNDITEYNAEITRLQESGQPFEAMTETTVDACDANCKCCDCGCCDSQEEYVTIEQFTPGFDGSNDCDYLNVDPDQDPDTFQSTLEGLQADLVEEARKIRQILDNVINSDAARAGLTEVLNRYEQILVGIDNDQKKIADAQAQLKAKAEELQAELDKVEKAQDLLALQDDKADIWKAFYEASKVKVKDTLADLETAANQEAAPTASVEEKQPAAVRTLLDAFFNIFK